MSKMNLKFVSMICAASSLLTYSCVDDDYDLTKDIDLTISVGGSEFAIPGGMTEEIKLSKVLKLDEGELVKTDNKGNYFLKQDGDEIESKIRVEGISIDAPNIESIDLSVEYPFIESMRTADLSIPLPAENNRSSFELEKSNLPVELKNISYIATHATGKVKLRFVQAHLRALYLEDVAIQFPSYIISPKLNAQKQLVLKDVEIKQGNVLEISVPIEGLNLSELPPGEGINSTNHTLYISGEVSVTGRVGVNRSDITGAFGPTLAFDLISTVDMGAITVASVTGVVKPDIRIDVPAIELNNIPDFLTDEEVKLDVKNPVIFLSVNNQTPVEASIQGTLSSYRASEKLAGPIQVSIPVVLKEQDQRFAISPSGNDLDGAKGIKAEINQLIYRIPDEIRFNIEAGTTDRETTVLLNKDYFIKTRYNVDVPFVFGPTLSIVYKDTIDGWQEDLEDFDIKQVNATADVVNKIPLALAFEAQAITTGSDGKPAFLNGVSIKVKANGKDDDNTIKAGANQNTGETTSIVIEIKETAAGSIKKLDGLILKATALSGQAGSGKQLNENQSIQLKNVKLKVPGGIKVNLN